FDGLKLAPEGEKRLRISKKGKEPAAHFLAAEETPKRPDRGMLVMVRRGGAAENLGAEFFVLLEEDESLAGHTVFGQVREGELVFLQMLRPEDVIVRIVIEKKRDHEYKPDVIQP
ncbi:MAG: peptidylprolyl isomerase, partial [Planctomycetota bacterium]